jgi:PBP1b-binding outer membrane lipoprotein LpoB
MQSRKLKNLMMLVFVLFIFSSCSSDAISPEPPLPPPAPPSPNENQISYAGEIQPIFTQKCAFCHGVGQAPPVLVAGKSYQSLMTSPGMVDTVVPGNSKLYKSMITGGSMAAYCNKANADSTYKWIRQGAKNN